MTRVGIAIHRRRARTMPTLQPIRAGRPGYMPASPPGRHTSPMGSGNPLMNILAPGATARRNTDAPAADPMRRLRGYREQVEGELTKLQELRAEEGAASTACIETLIEELEGADRERRADAEAANKVIEELRSENALLTAAASRIHSQWKRDATELESLRAELKVLDAQNATQRAEALEMMHRGAELADAKYRSSEKRRAIDVGVLSRELREHEASGVALLAEQQLTALRLHADAKCAATEIRELEADHEEELLAMAARRRVASGARTQGGGGGGTTRRRGGACGRVEQADTEDRGSTRVEAADHAERLRTHRSRGGRAACGGDGACVGDDAASRAIAVAAAAIEQQQR